MLGTLENLQLTTIINGLEPGHLIACDRNNNFHTFNASLSLPTGYQSDCQTVRESVKNFIQNHNGLLQPTLLDSLEQKCRRIKAISISTQPSIFWNFLAYFFRFINRTPNNRQLADNQFLETLIQMINQAKTSYSPSAATSYPSPNGPPPPPPPNGAPPPPPPPPNGKLPPPPPPMTPGPELFDSSINPTPAKLSAEQQRAQRLREEMAKRANPARFFSAPTEGAAALKLIEEIVKEAKKPKYNIPPSNFIQYLEETRAKQDLEVKQNCKTIKSMQTSSNGIKDFHSEFLPAAANLTNQEIIFLIGQFFEGKMPTEGDSNYQLFEKLKNLYEKDPSRTTNRLKIDLSQVLRDIFIEYEKTPPECREEFSKYKESWNLYLSRELEGFIFLLGNRADPVKYFSKMGAQNAPDHTQMESRGNGTPSSTSTPRGSLNDDLARRLSTRSLSAHIPENS
jgi:hypothetical protein